MLLSEISSYLDWVQLDKQLAYNQHLVMQLNILKQQETDSKFVSKEFVDKLSELENNMITIMDSNQLGQID